MRSLTQGAGLALLPFLQQHHVRLRMAAQHAQDFLCRRVAGDLAAASDAAEVRWFTTEELPALKLAEDTFDVIRKGFMKAATGG